MFPFSVTLLLNVLFIPVRNIMKEYHKIAVYIVNVISLFIFKVIYYDNFFRDK